MPSSSSEGGLGAALVGEKVIMGQLQLTVTKLIGEGELVTCTAVRRIASGYLCCFGLGAGGTVRSQWMFCCIRYIDCIVIVVMDAVLLFC